MRGELFDPHFFGGALSVRCDEQNHTRDLFSSLPFFMFWRFIFFIMFPLSAAHKFAAQGGVVVRVVVCVCVAGVIVLCCCCVVFLVVLYFLFSSFGDLS